MSEELRTAELTDEELEICRMYREAKAPGKQIGILADLHDCSRAKIKEILVRGGCELPKTGQRKRKASGGNPVDTQDARQDGDGRQIAVPTAGDEIPRTPWGPEGETEAPREDRNAKEEPFDRRARALFEERLDVLSYMLGELRGKRAILMTMLLDHLLDYAEAGFNDDLVIARGYLERLIWEEEAKRGE